MSLFSPEKMLSMLGINPEECAKVFAFYRQRFEAIEAELNGFKTGFRSVVDHFAGRLDRIERQNAEILRHLSAMNGNQPGQGDDASRAEVDRSNGVPQLQLVKDGSNG